jgi:flagellar protein FliO/FliZ
MQALTIFFAFVAVLALIGIAAWVVRRFASNRLGTNTQRGRMPRLAVIDAAAVDGRRRLVLVRRDNIEHLLMIGGPTDIVVESNIVRVIPGREQMPQRSGIAPEPPPRIAPLPETIGWSDTEAAREEHAESQMHESPLRPARPSFVDELRRPTPSVSERRNDLGGFAPEQLAGRSEGREGRIEPRGDARAEVRPEPRPETIPQRMPRAEPIIPRPSRETPKPTSLRAAERAGVAPIPTPSAPPPAVTADQNLAEMAQRLEAALRRPAATEKTSAPSVAPEPPANAQRNEPPGPAKGNFENLEDEMASLLGRPKPSSSSS